MENEKYLIDEIRQKIKSTVSPCYENTAKTELYVRCPHCGDSKKSKSSAHLYIQMKPPFKFFCQKCGFSGVLNQNLLESLQVFDSSIVSNITELTKNSVKKSFTNTKRSQVKIDYDEQPTDLTRLSLKYFNDRFGVNETEESIKKFNAICDPIQFFEHLYTKHGIRVSYNPKFDYYNSMGFLSTDRKYLICRDVGGTQNIRYTNTPISNDIDKSKIYNIKTKVDKMSPEITLVITEGIFDAIGVYYKEYENKENIIISAACGKSFEQVILYFMKLGFLNLNIKIYSDADVDINYYKNIKRKNKIIAQYPIEIYYNTIGKDCGVPKDQILLRKTTI